jgi:hypothetical protein
MLKTGQNFLAISDLFKRELGEKIKISEAYLKIFFKRPGMISDDFALLIAGAIDESDLETACKIYDDCDRHIKADLLIPNTSLNYGLVERLNLSTEDVVGSFLVKNNLVRREIGIVAKFLNVDEETGFRLKELLSLLPYYERKSIIEGMDADLLRAIVLAEIENFIYNEGVFYACPCWDRERSYESFDPRDLGAIFSSMEIGDKIPESLTFLSWLQDKHYNSYDNLMSNIIIDYRDLEEINSLDSEKEVEKNETNAEVSFEKIKRLSEIFLDKLLK